MNSIKDDLLKNLPKKYSSQVNEEIMSMVDDMGKDMAMESDDVTGNIIDFMPSIKELNGITLKKYMEALKYIFIKKNCNSSLEAWKIAFRGKYNELRSYGKERDASKYSSAYNNSKLVTKLEAATMVAFSIQYAHFRHAAIKSTFDIMNGKASYSEVPRYMRSESGKILLDSNGQKLYMYDADGRIEMENVYQVVSPMVQQQAAASILEITKPTEENDINITVGISDESTEQFKRIADSIESVALAQRKALLDGANINDVQKIGHIIEAELVHGEKRDDN